MDQQQTFEWLRRRVYEELEPEVTRLRAENLALAERAEKAQSIEDGLVKTIRSLRERLLNARDEALEEAAVSTETYANEADDNKHTQAGINIAARIRALKGAKP